MKIYEVQSAPHLYLDIDGVQADFFGEWSRRSGVSHWKSIANKEQEIEELAHSSAEEVYDFFANLKPLQGGAKVVAWLKGHSIPFTVCSAPLRGPYQAASIQAKKDWLDRYNPGTSSSAIFTAKKYKYAMNGGRPNVLVDDYGKYLSAWATHGGIAVKHEDEYEKSDSWRDTIDRLKQIYNI